MWGNRQGWIISAVITVITVVLYTILLLGPSVSAPTDLTTRAGAMDAITLPGNPQSLLTGGGSADTAELYRQAISNYRSTPDAFDSYYKTGKLNSPAYKAVIPTIDLLVQASQSSNPTVFSKRPDAIVRYNPDQFLAMAPLDQLGHVALRIGLQYNAAKKPDLAKKYWQAAYALGCAMVNERLTFRELQIGQDLLATSSINLGGSDVSNAAAFRGINASSPEFMKKLMTYMALFNPSDQRVISNNAGDVFNLAQNSKERMWRDEAIMMLGHYRYNAVNPGDQVGARKALEKLAGDSTLDPAVAAAVKVAQELTPEQHSNSQNIQ
ncbi:hypothetical protein BH10PLA1_BH10PLA1_12480 [soil metagenome]